MTQPATRTLWRPVGHNELSKIKQAHFKAFPPRLPEQPIFYPVLNFEYAEQIARDWNSTDPRHDFLGYVTEFDVTTEIVDSYEPHQVGSQAHLELWVPAEELAHFNDALLGEIRIAAESDMANESADVRRTDPSPDPSAKSASDLTNHRTARATTELPDT